MTPGSTPDLTPALQATGIHKSYGRHTVLCGAHLTVAPGQLVAVVGENGAGKSTAPVHRPAVLGSRQSER